MSPTPQTQFACLACNGVDNHEPTCRHADLHARIAAAVDKRRTWAGKGSTGQGRDFMLAACDHADDVLARHRLDPFNAKHGCWHCRATAWPCPEVRALADLWLGEDWAVPDGPVCFGEAHR